MGTPSLSVVALPSVRDVTSTCATATAGQGRHARGSTCHMRGSNDGERGARAWVDMPHAHATAL
eukprot:154304-Chlamydomonas_euryale.AAC.7